MQSIIPVSPPGDLSPAVAELDRQLRGRVHEFKICPDGGGLALTRAEPLIESSSRQSRPSACTPTLNSKQLNHVDHRIE